MRLVPLETPVVYEVREFLAIELQYQIYLSSRSSMEQLAYRTSFRRSDDLYLCLKLGIDLDRVPCATPNSACAFSLLFKSITADSAAPWPTRSDFFRTPSARQRQLLQLFREFPAGHVNIGRYDNQHY